MTANETVNTQSKKSRTPLFIGIGCGVILFCILVAGGISFWALNNPTISASLIQFTSTFSDMAKLQQEISAAYPADAVQVGINNGHNLTVTLVNSSANKLSGAEQREKAKEIALFAKSHYSNLDGIDTIVISLVQQNGAFGFTMNFTNNYVFKLSELQ